MIELNKFGGLDVYEEDGTISTNVFGHRRELFFRNHGDLMSIQHDPALYDYYTFEITNDDMGDRSTVDFTITKRQLELITEWIKLTEKKND